MPMRPRLALLLVLGLCCGGCGALSSLNTASRALDTYALNPLPTETAGRRGAAILFVAEPTAPGAAASDRIVIKPNPLQVTLLADGRWVESAPAHLRSVLARSFANTGRFAFVTTAALGPLPDYTVLVDIESFEARVLPPGGAPARVVVSMTLSLVRGTDGGLAASRRFTEVADAADTDALSIVSAFEVANNALLRQAVPWATAVMTGAAGA
jgi:cholesterol transport system auxiliary component